VSIDINTNISVSPKQSTSGSSYGFTACILNPVDSKVILIPQYSNPLNAIQIYDDFTNLLNLSKTTITNGTYTQDNEFAGAVLLPDGNVVCIPYTNSFICTYDPKNDNIPLSSCISVSGFNGGVLTPTGNVVCVPYSQYPTSNIGIYTPATSTASATFTNVITNTGTTAFCGGCLLPTGNVILAPYSSSNVGMFSPSTLAYSNLVTVLNIKSGGPQCRGCVLCPDGRVVFVINNCNITGKPCIIMTLNMNTPAPREMCLSPFFNKF
jgi:hypothetical protein